MTKWPTPRFRRALAAVAVAASSGSCIVEDSRCGPNQVLDATNPSLCKCVAGAVINAAADGCIKCGENEVVVSNLCQCTLGYAPESAGGPCVKSTTSLAGYPCSETEPCSEPNPYCATVSGISFCTKLGGCTVSADCPANLVCHAEGDTRFCARVAGLGDTCATRADCPATAAYCENYSTKVCLMEGCAANPGSCPSAWSCCDLTGLLETSLCVPDAVLMNGACVDGSAPVKP